MTHLHHWTPFLKDAEGYYQKRDMPTGKRWYSGVVQECECGWLRLVPHDRRLQTVMVEIERRHAKD